LVHYFIVKVIIMANYLVTGVAGFIGSSIARELVSRGETVRGLDDFSTGKRENIEEMKGRLDFHEVSLLNPAGLTTACKGVDYVIHQAALPSVPKSVADPKLTNSVNVEGTLNLLVAAREIRAHPTGPGRFIKVAAPFISVAPK